MFEIKLPCFGWERKLCTKHHYYSVDYNSFYRCTCWFPLKLRHVKDKRLQIQCLLFSCSRRGKQPHCQNHCFSYRAAGETITLSLPVFVHSLPPPPPPSRPLQPLAWDAYCCSLRVSWDLSKTSFPLDVRYRRLRTDSGYSSLTPRRCFEQGAC